MNDPIPTSYPHEHLSRLAEEMTDQVPDNSGIRAVVFVDDNTGGCIHSVGYPEPQDRVDSMIFIDVAAHLYELGRALGIDIGVTVNGQAVPFDSFAARLTPDRK